MRRGASRLERRVHVHGAALLRVHHLRRDRLWVLRKEERNHGYQLQRVRELRPRVTRPRRCRQVPHARVRLQQLQAEGVVVAIIARKVMGTYQCRCTTCDAQWVSSFEDGGEEGKQHKH